MADLKPLGSEKLQGQEKISRILEIANYGSKPSTVNESKSSSADYTIQLADGNFYGIVKEKSGYIVKKGINESELDYIEPMKNRKYHKSYSQAMKKINLLAGELNRIHENVEGVNLIGEQKKFVLKTPKPEPEAEPEMDLDLGVEEPAPESGEEEMDLDLDLGVEEPTPEGGDEEMDLDLDMEEPMGDEGDDDEASFKTIQKLTGKLGQKLRTFDKNQGLSSEDIKYVLNSIISAVELEKLTEEDKEDILDNFEEDEIDYGIDDEADLDIDAGEELDLDLGDEEISMEEPEGEMAEGDSMKTMVDELFGESKVDKVLEKYFVITEEEKQITESKKIKKFLTEKVKGITVKKEIKRLSETIEQELTSEFLVKENENIKFLGKTNKNNLVFEADGKQFKVSPKGELL